MKQQTIATSGITSTSFPIPKSFIEEVVDPQGDSEDRVVARQALLRGVEELELLIAQELDGASIRGLSQSVGQSKSTVANRLAKARARLKGALA